MKRNTYIKLKVIECNSETNLVVLQTGSRTFTLNSEDFANFIESATPVKEKIAKSETIHSVIVKEILDHLNEKSGRSFPYNDKNEKFISARLADGETPDILKKVIEVKCFQWKNNVDFKKYLRPETLFNSTKFQSYKQEVLDILIDPEAFKKHVKAKENDRINKEYDNLAELATRRPSK